MAEYLQESQAPALPQSPSPCRGDSQMDLRHKSAKAFAWSAIQTWGTQAISFFVFLALARLLGPEAFGLVALASVSAAFAQIFLDQGFGDAIVQRAELEREHLDTAFWTGIVTGGLLTVGGIAASGLVAQFFHEPQLAPIVGWLSLSFLFGALSSVQQAILRRQLAFKSLAVRSFAATIVGGVVAVSMAFLGFGVWSLVTKSLVTGLVGVVVLWQVSDWRPGFNLSKKHFKDLFAFGLNIVGSNFVDFFNRRSDDFLIGYFLGPTALGYYTLAYNLLLVMTSILTSVPNTVAFPAFSRLQNEPGRMRRTFYEAMQLTTMIAFPAFLGMSVLAPEVVLALYGPEWTPSVPVVQILAFVGILHSVQYFHGNVVKAAGKPSWRFGILLLLAIFNVTGFALAVRWGIVAVAAAYLIVSYLVFPLYLLAIRSLIRVDFRTYLRQYVPQLTGSLTMVAIVLGLKYILGEELGLYLRLFIYVLAGGLTYLLILHLTARSLSRRVLELVRLVLS